MKNVLLLTNIYPNNDPNYGGTAVCHSFTKEWVKMGYHVRVVHFDSLFPRPYYWLGALFNAQIQAKTGTVAYTKTPRKPKNYFVDGIPVTFVPLKKLIPHKSPSQKQILKAFQYVTEQLEQNDFIPDVVTGHFVLPQLEMLHLFKQKYPQIRTCLVLHGSGSLIKSTYPDRYQELMQSVDVWGFRSSAFKSNFEKTFGVFPNEFLCHSGIPEKYLEPLHRNFSNGVKKFVFVGSLYELKNVDITLRALHQAMEGKEYTFDIVGSGAENNHLHQLVQELKMEDHVIFHGQMSRDAAQNIIKNADCFVMVSSREAFGLVYVEAMAKGCIVIGTKGQGIDGVVKDGENGFLCKAKDVNELADVMRQITSLNQASLEQISNKAVAVANELTDRKVTKKYINSIFI